LKGTPIAKPRRDIGVVFQSPVLFPWRSVLGNVMLPADVQRLDRVQLRRRAMDLIKLVRLDGFEHRYPWELSGGMQQRVGIARALVHDPAMLLMDEPFGALDAMTRESMNVELQRIWMERRKTVLFITHSVGEAVFLADRVLVMTPWPGKIQDDLTIDLARPRSLEIMNTEAFGAYVRRIRFALNALLGANYQAYYDWLLVQNVIKQKLDAKEAFTNELIDDINTFDAAEVTAMAEAYKAK
jgi:NitT/TauT family transport system ATP-binding protein